MCAVLPSGDPNHVTDDLAAHIALVHRLATTDFISFVTSVYWLVSPVGTSTDFGLISRL